MTYRSKTLLLIIVFVLAAGNLEALYSAGDSDAADSIAETSTKPVILDLDMVMRIAMAHNTDLQRSEMDIRAAELDVDSLERNFHPNAWISGGFSSQWSDSGPNAGWSDPKDSASVRFSSSYTVFNGFADTASLAAGRSELSAVTSGAARSRENVLFQVISLFMDASAAKSQIAVQEENLAAQRELLRKIDAFYTAGKRPVSDLFQQQAEVASAEYKLLSAVRDYELQVLNLAETIGLTPGQPFEISTAQSSAVCSRITMPDNPAAAIEQAQKNRSDYVANLASLAASEEYLKAAKGGYWPEVSLSLDSGTSYNDSAAGSLSDQLLSDNPYVSLGLSISLPLYDRHRTQNSVALADLQIRRTQLARMDLERQISGEILTAYLDYQTVLQQLSSAETRINYTRQALESYEERYGVNAATLVEVIQARAQHIDALYQKIAAECNLVKKRVALGYYIGDIDKLITPSSVLSGDIEHEVNE